MAAPTYVAAGADVNSSTTTMNVPVPAGVAKDDIVLIPIYLDDSLTLSGLPTGFAHVTGSPWAAVEGEVKPTLVWKRLTEADAGNYTFTKSGSAWSSGQAFAFRGCLAEGDPFEAIDYADAGSSGDNFANVSVDMLGPERMLALFAINYDGDTDSYSAPDGTWTLATAGAGDANVGLAYKSTTNPTSSGSVSISAGGAPGANTDIAFASILVALRPEGDRPTLEGVFVEHDGADPITQSVTTENGDLLIIFAATENESIEVDSISGGSLTYTPLDEINVSNNCHVYAWSADVTTGATFTLSVGVTGAGAVTVTVLRYQRHNGVGTVAKTNSTGSPSLNITTTEDGSSIAYISADWNAVDGSGRTYRQINSLDPYEAEYHFDSGSATYYVGHHEMVGAAGSKTVGLSNPGSQTYAIIAVEILPEIVAEADQTVIDDFEDGSVAGFWDNWGPMSETGGVMTTSAGTTADSYEGIDYTDPVDFADQTFYGVQLWDLTEHSTIEAYPVDAWWVDGDDGFSWKYDGATGQLQAWSYDAGVYTQRGSSFDFDENVHVYFALGINANSELSWRWSTDGLQWTEHTTLANPFPDTSPAGLSFYVRRVTANATAVTFAFNDFSSWQFDEQTTTDPYPDVAATIAGADSVNGTSHVISTFPSGTTAGDLLVVVYSVDGSPTCSTTSTGWDKIGQASNGANVTGAVFWKIATGSDSLTITTSASERGTWVIYRITGHDPSAPIAGSASANGSSTNSNPPNVAPAAGSGAYLWIVTRSGDANLVQATAAPTNYGALINSDESASGGAATATAWRKATASSEDPGTFTSGSEQWVSWTIAIAPEGTAEGSAPFTIDVSMAATGGRMSLGTAPFTADIAMAATGARPSRGSADFTLDLNLGVSSRSPREGTAAFTLDIGMAATGISPTPDVNHGTAPFTLDVGMAATGSRMSVGTGDLGVSVGMTGVGGRMSVGEADFTVDVSMAGTGTAPVPSGVAAFTIDVSMTAVGVKPAIGSAAFSVQLNVNATGDAPAIPAAQGSADFTLGVTLAVGGAGVARYIPVRVLTASERLLGNRHTTFYVDLLDTDDAPIGRLDGVEDGNLEWLYNAVVKGSGSMLVSDVSQDINWLTARLKPVMLIDGLDPQPLGVFLPSEAPEAYGPGRRWTVKLLDKTTILDQDTIEETYALAAGSVVTDEIITVIESSGIFNHSITPSTATLATAMVWSPGTSKIRIINDLLATINYFSLYANFDGQMVGAPYTRPAARPIVYEFIDGSTSIYRPDFVRDVDIWTIPNRVTVVSVGDGSTEALTSTVTNTDPASPYSSVSRGRVIGRTETGIDIADQSTLDDYAQRRLIELTSPTAGVKIFHAPVPGLAVNQVARFRRVPAGIDARHAVTKTSIKLQGTALAQTTFREVVDL